MLTPGYKAEGSYLTAVSFVGAPRCRWWFACDCGKRVIREASKVLNLHTRSCGCYRRKHSAKVAAGIGGARERKAGVTRTLLGTRVIRQPGVVKHRMDGINDGGRSATHPGPSKYGRPDLFAFTWPPVGVAADVAEAA